MQLSRLTFSLASLVVLLALGLIFAPLSAIAHDNVGDTDTHAKTGHMHPTVTVVVMDADPNTDGTQVIPKTGNLDDGAAADDREIAFDVMIVLDDAVPLERGSGATGTAGDPIAADAFSPTSITVSAYNDQDGAVANFPAAGATVFATYTEVADSDGLKWETEVSFVLDDDTLDTTTDAQQVAAAIAAGINLDLTAIADLVRADVIRGNYFNDTSATATDHAPYGSLASEMVMVKVVAAAAEVETPLPTVEVSVPNNASLTESFVATFTFNEAQTTFTSADITVTPAGSGISPPMAIDDPNDTTDSAAAPNMKVWTATIYPNVPAGTDSIMIGVAATKATMKMDADDMDIGTATVPVPGQVAMGAISVPAMSYVVVVPPMANTDALPQGLMVQELAGFVDLHGHASTTGLTIDVTSPSGGAANSVIITEIMVATDTGRIGMTGMDSPSAGQWIELYNTTAAAATVNIAFATGFPAAAKPTGSVDRFSNVASPGGWNFVTAFGGALTGTTQPAATGTGRVVTANFNSLRRVHKDGKRLGETGAAIQDGTKQGTWTLTANTRVFLPGRIGTPGAENRPKVFEPATFTAPTMSVTFNEIANRTSGDDWIELKGAADTNLKKYKIDIVTAYDKAANTGTESKIYHFPDADVKIPASGILLLVKQSPTNTELAADKEKNVEKPVRYRIASDMAELPSHGNFLLVLRNADGKILDVAGHLANLSDDDPYRTLYPLNGNAGRISAKNKLAGGKVYDRRRGIQGYSSNKDNGDEPAFESPGFTGIGYDRNATITAENHGTPGYPNNVQIGDGTAATDNIIISEIMYGGPKNNLAQWIELYNMSATNSVHLNGWKLSIVNHHNADFTGKILDSVTLSSLKIPPKQTALIVSRANSHNTQLPSTGGHRILNRRLDVPMLSTSGFYLLLEAKPGEADVAKRQKADEVGNLVAFDSTDRPDHQAYADTVWALPMGITEDGRRVSISRKLSAKIMKLDGTSEWHWIPSDMDNRQNNMGVSTYYGRNTDVGSPGQTRGEALPVQLSKFRPERLKDTGEIVIRWITESELNNAGFNILRSETRDGEFTKINTSLIAGQGTTSERTTYEWKDKSAKPNVVYYYQIQDVSLDGNVQTLRQSRLKGNVTAAGKLTTTWGELKALQ